VLSFKYEERKGGTMSYYLARTLKGISFEETEAKLREELEKEGFGIISEISVNEILKKKLDIDFRPYKILGACNPRLALEALTAEDKVGVLLPCNFIIQEKEDGVEVAAIDPMRSMEIIGKPELKEIAYTVQARFKKVLENMTPVGIA
jgi:uncharacterized protein (DUF302 family)